MKRFKCFVLLLVLTLVPVFSQSESQVAFFNILEFHRVKPVIFSIQPEASVPLGSEVIGTGAGVRLSVEMIIPPAPVMGFGLQTDYIFNPVLETDMSLSTIGVSGFLSGNLAFNRWIEMGLSAGGGYYYSFLNSETDYWNSLSGLNLIDVEAEAQYNPMVSAGAELRFRIMPDFILGAGVSYNNFLGLYQGLGASLAISFQPRLKETAAESSGPLPGEHFRIETLEIDNLFPVFYKYYDDHPFGYLQAVNDSTAMIRNLYLSFHIPEYMDSPVRTKLADRVLPEETAELAIKALFTQNILTITEATKSSALIKLEYSIGDQVYYAELNESIRLYDRNAIIWDDDRRAAAFVTAHDLAVLGFAKPVASLVSGIDRNIVNKPLATAMALHRALGLYGLNYVIDPKTPYSEFSGQQMQLDYLQFPRYTLSHTAGDCDDLSILYAALLESVGIPTAFVTIPGHIFMAFSTGMNTDEAVKVLGGADNIIDREGTAWIPLEITMVQETFLNAWSHGAREWRENAPMNKAGFFPLNEAWQIFEPVGLPSDPPGMNFPPIDDVEAALNSELDSFIGQMISEQEAEYLERLSDNEDPRVRNRLAVLYARYGLLEKAEEQFRMILEQRELLSAVANLGNIYFLQEKYPEAFDQYDRYYRARPDKASALLNMARINYELANYSETADFYNLLKVKDPDLAEAYGYLGMASSDTSRAADPAERFKSPGWEEE